MHRLVNTTPFCGELDIFPDARGRDTLFVTLKATFRPGPPLAIHAQQVPIHVADVYWGESDASSLRFAGERHLARPGTDVVLVGSAHAPDERPVSALDVSLTLATIRKVVRVVGDRRWRPRLARPGPPGPFLSMPLLYERAFGGPEVAHNPVGVGTRFDTLLPNLEDPRRPLTEMGAAPPPMCFAPLAPSWSPRREFAGTYDAGWRRRRAPYLPDDFDPRFFQIAPPDQICTPHLRGGERVEVLHAAPAPLRFILPRCVFSVRARVGADELALSPQLELVLLEPDDDRFCLLWRAAAPVDGRVLAVEKVTVELQRMIA